MRPLQPAGYKTRSRIMSAAAATIPTQAIKIEKVKTVNLPRKDDWRGW